MAARKTASSKNPSTEQKATDVSTGIDRPAPAPGRNSGRKPRVSDAIQISPLLQVVLVLLWGVLIAGAYGPVWPIRQLEYLRRVLGGRAMFAKVFQVLAGIHVLELVAVAVVSVWKSIALDDMAVALGYVALFGVHGSVPFLKLALKRKA
ncbi:hypothetical protein HDU86_000707 [Geranomyces michiganensis]|nr:hypothetical protein HDU86_000707 [Geranomyces michiganensis]